MYNTFRPQIDQHGKLYYYSTFSNSVFFPSKELVGNKEVLLPHQEEEVEDEL